MAGMTGMDQPHVMHGEAAVTMEICDHKINVQIMISV
jgi:hypothetical protein